MALWENVDAALQEATKFYGNIKKINTTYGGKSPSPAPPPPTVTGLPQQTQNYLMFGVLILAALIGWALLRR